MDTQCSQPIPVQAGRHVRLARCSACAPCLRAAQRYWAAAAANQIRAAASIGCRSWMGTCTFAGEAQALLQRAAEAASSGAGRAWDQLTSDECASLIQQQALRQVQK